MKLLKNRSSQIKHKNNIITFFVLLAIINLVALYFFISRRGENKLALDLLVLIVCDLIAWEIISNFSMFRNIFKLFWKERSFIVDLSINDFQSKFVGSLLGRIWAFIQPIVMMGLYWFVFQVGLRAGNVKEYPFIIFLMSGLIPWFYYSEVMSSGTGVLMEYSYLVKKVLFNVEILPLIKMISSLFVHVFFVGFIIVVCALYGYYPSLYSIQLIYYIFCMDALLLGTLYLLSSCNAFFRDVTQIVTIMLTIGIWITPIMWSPDEAMPMFLRLFFMSNPLYYLIDGFRDALLAHVWFWQKPFWTLYFWLFCISINVIGLKMFEKLKQHFADVI